MCWLLCVQELQFRGRIRVQMRNDDGSFCNPELNSRESIMMYVSTRIPQLKTRQAKPGGEAQPQYQQQPQQQTSGGGGGGGGGKKGKGKRR